MTKTLIAVFAVAFVLTAPSLARACMCGNTDAAGAFLSADVVFIGKVIKITHAKQASVGLLVKESGTLELLKVPRWEKSLDPARIVTLEVTDSLKGNAAKTFQLVTARYDNGATCGVNFKMGESFLVYAHKQRHELSADEAKIPKNEWSKEIKLKAEADRYNQRLPAFETSLCARTERMRWAKDDLDVIRDILKNGLPNNLRREQPKPARLSNDDAQQIVGRERRERVSQDNWSRDA
ncbi:MAG: hypothetical protein ACT4OT_02250 [Acidobacteriota bacterium]